MFTHLLGRAECPRCAGVLDIADEYESSHRPPVAKNLYWLGGSDPLR